MLPVAGLLAGEEPLAKVCDVARAGAGPGGRRRRCSCFKASAGGFRTISPTRSSTAVWPIWTGEPVPAWRFDERFCRNLTALAAPEWVAGLSPRWQGIQFLPVLLFQAVGIFGLWRFGLDRALQDRVPASRRQTWVLISSKSAVAIARSARMLRLRRIERDQMRGHDS